jgi:prophage DNA circulation protein
MTTLLDNLYPASFNGISFLMENDSVQTGKLTTTHQYLFKKYSYTEELGAKLRSFSIRAIVTGSDYEIRREALMLALKSDGAGILMHAFYGLVTVICTGFTVLHDTREVGISSFEISFEETLSGIYPSFAGATNSSVSKLAATNISSLKSNFASNYTMNSFKNISYSADKCLNFNQTLNNNLVFANDISSEDKNNFISVSQDLNKNIYSIVQSSTELSTYIDNLLNCYDSLGSTFINSYNLNANAFSFNPFIDFIDYYTIVSDERENNDKLLGSTFNAILLCNLYKNAAFIPYVDTEQLDAIANDLETKYQFLLLNNNLDRSILLLIEQLRSQTKKYLSQVRIDITKIINSEVPDTPLTVLSYRFYANFENQDEIVKLNNIMDCSTIGGNIRMPTEN